MTAERRGPHRWLAMSLCPAALNQIKGEREKRTNRPLTRRTGCLDGRTGKLAHPVNQDGSSDNDDAGKKTQSKDDWRGAAIKQVVFWDAALPQSRAFGRYGRTKHQARARGGLPLMHENAEPVSKLIDLSPIHQFCPVSPLDRTKLFHVKQFCPIDAPRNAPS